MWKNLSLTAAVTLALLLSGKVYYLQQDNQQLRAQLAKEKQQENHLANELQKEEVRLRQEEAQLKEKEALVNAERKTKTDRLKVLETTLLQQQMKVEQLKSKISDLQNVKENPNQDVVKQRIHQGETRLKELQQRLNGYKSSENEVTQERSDRLKQQQLEQKNILTELNSRIGIQKTNVKLAEQQLKAREKDKRDPNQNQHVDQARQQLSEQQMGLKNLEAQKQTEILRTQEQAQSIKTTAGEEKEDLKETQTQIQKQINELKLEINHYKDSKSQDEKQSSQHQKQLQDTQKSYNQEVSKAQDLQKQILELRRELGNQQ